MIDALWPYAIVILAGFLPNEAFRVAGVVLARGVDETSELFTWIRLVALTLLAAVVAKLLYSPPSALAGVPLAIRIAAVGVAVAGFYLSGRRLLVGILAGEAALIGAAWAFG